MLDAGLLINTFIPGAFTSMFWMLTYSVIVAIMLRIGVRDNQVQGWIDQGIA